MKRTDAEIRKVVRIETERRRIYMSKYWAKNKKELGEYRRKWASKSRNDPNAAFIARGYVHKTGMVEVLQVVFYKPKKKGSLTR